MLTEVAKFASSPNAAANSFKVFNVSGAESTIPATAESTYAVVAICVLFVPDVAVGAVGVPVRDGDASGAFAFKAVCVALEMGLFASLVLSTLPKPTSDFTIPSGDVIVLFVRV